MAGGCGSDLSYDGKASDRKITLVRHGRSAHVHTGWVDLEGFLRWRQMYEAAGIDAGDAPPVALREVSAAAGLIVASDIRRAVESARLLAPDARIEVSPLFRELALVPPRVGGLRMPMVGWALAYGVRMLVHKAGHVTPAEEERAREAVRWLEERVAEHGSVVVVTHASFRWLLAKTLRAEGWRGDLPRRRRSAHWSAWEFVR
jgi:broad specificity phosphatase PhoE